jgi:glucokinase
MEKIITVLGYDIGGTKIAVSLGQSDGKMLASRRIENLDTYPEDVLPLLVKAAHEMVAEVGIKLEDIAAVGIDSPSPADIPNGIIVAPPNNQHWRDVHIKDYLHEALGLEVFFANDADAGALAEWIFGAGRGCSNMIYLTMSTGIGGGIIANEALIQGASYYAGEVGHICIDPNGPECNCGMHGCYEAFCGGRALALRMQRELADKPDSAVVKHAGGKIEDIDMLALEKAILDGDAYAVKLWDEVILRHAQALGTYLNVLNPEKIVLGTLAWAMGNDLFMKPIMEQLPKFSWDATRNACEIVCSELRRDIGAYAPLAVALYCLHLEGRFEFPWKQ